MVMFSWMVGWSGGGAGLGQRIGSRVPLVLGDSEPRLDLDPRRQDGPCARMGDQGDDERERDEDGGADR